jgi:hypothetical protein
MLTDAYETPEGELRQVMLPKEALERSVSPSEREEAIDAVDRTSALQAESIDDITPSILSAARREAFPHLLDILHRTPTPRLHTKTGLSLASALLGWFPTDDSAASVIVDSLAEPVEHPVEILAMAADALRSGIRTKALDRIATAVVGIAVTADSWRKEGRSVLGRLVGYSATARTECERILLHESETERLYLVGALLRARNWEAALCLARHAGREPSPRVRLVLYEGTQLGRHTLKQDVETLLEDPSPWWRWMGLGYLKHLDEPERRELLLRALEDEPDPHLCSLISRLVS